jgi:transcription elongation factor SPT6
LCAEYPGKFLLSYQPNMKSFHEYITITPDGYRYRQQPFRSVSQLFKWFKLHFNDRSTFPRTPVATPSVVRTPAGSSSFINSTGTPNIDPQAIQRAAASMPTHVFNALSQVAGQTPSFGGAAQQFGSGSHSSSMGPPFGGHSRGFYGQSGGSQATPIMTPNMTTPRNYPNTPGSMPPPANIPSHQRPGSRSGQQWGSIAEGWNQKPKVKDRTPLYNTPGASSQMSISPNTNTPNVRGDQTPLVDEWN